jgi:hypothetical protein
MACVLEGNGGKASRQIAEPIVSPTDASIIEAEIKALEKEALPTRRGDLVLYLASAKGISHVVREICYLREIKFRQTGEGRAG